LKFIIVNIFDFYTNFRKYYLLFNLSILQNKLNIDRLCHSYFIIFWAFSFNFYFFYWRQKHLSMTKTKILCLHGYGTNAAFMKKQSVFLQKLL